tara:strand:+ start:1112 stop:1357 length:246 start_codon:yes stop_codon:yes gene_type:complete
MLTKAVMPQLDAIVQKAESIVLVGSKKEHGGSHLRHRFYVNGLSPIGVPALKNSSSIYFWKDDSKQSEGNGVKLKSIQEDY